MTSLSKTLQSLLKGQIKVSNIDSIFSKIADFLMSLNLSSILVPMFAALERYCSQPLPVALLK